MLSKQFISYLIMAASLAGCAGPREAANTAGHDGVIDVVATTGMIADIARNIGGDRVEVTQLLGAGVDPHLYQATESDLEILQSAEIIFYNGLNLEAQMADLLHQLGEEDDIITVAVGEAIPPAMVRTEISRADVPDPHIWMDPQRWSLVAQAIRDTLGKYDPDSADLYDANAEAYLAELAELDQTIRTSIATVPEDQRILVTAHDAFQYYSDAYDIQVFAPQGISTEAEASVADIEAAVNFVVENRVPAIFFESSIPVDTVEAIIEGARAQGHEIALGGELFSDAMGDPGTEQGTYIGMISHNTEVIVTALGGTFAPEG